MLGYLYHTQYDGYNIIQRPCLLLYKLLVTPQNGTSTIISNAHDLENASPMFKGLANSFRQHSQNWTVVEAAMATSLEVSSKKEGHIVFPSGREMTISQILISDIFTLSDFGLFPSSFINCKFDPPPPFYSLVRDKCLYTNILHRNFLRFTKPRVLSANRVDLGFFFIKLLRFTPPPPQIISAKTYLLSKECLCGWLLETRLLHWYAWYSKIY